MAGHHGQDGHHVMTTVFVPVKDFATIQGTCNRAVETQMYTGWKRKRRSALRRYVQVKITFTKSFKYNFQKSQLSHVEKKNNENAYHAHVLPCGKGFGKVDSCFSSSGRFLYLERSSHQSKLVGLLILCPDIIGI